MLLPCDVRNAVLLNVAHTGTASGHRNHQLHPKQMLSTRPLECRMNLAHVFLKGTGTQIEVGQNEYALAS